MLLRAFCPQADLGEFDKLMAFLAASYPRVHANLERTVVNGHSLLFRWRAKGTPTALPYIVNGSSTHIRPHVVMMFHRPRVRLGRP